MILSEWTVQLDVMRISKNQFTFGVIISMMLCCLNAEEYPETLLI